MMDGLRTAFVYVWDSFAETLRETGRVTGTTADLSVLLGVTLSRVKSCL